MKSLKTLKEPITVLGGQMLGRDLQTSCCPVKAHSEDSLPDLLGGLALVKQRYRFGVLSIV